jgi:hypothetical protein
MKRLLSPLFLLLISVFTFNCQKELSAPGGQNPGGNIPAPAPVTATVQGKVVDENNQPASGVSIKVGSKTATTDSRGYFRITNASLDKNASLVIAEKAGYFKALRSFQATMGANHISVKLIKKTLTGTVNSSAGGDVTLTNGAKVTLPANAVVKAAGGVYNGTINVYAAYIDPSATDIAQTVPGSFMADDKDGKRVTLTSFGMLAVELESTSGEKLQIATDKTATLTAPIPSSALAAAPSSIPLWYVDEQTGIWKEEGMATKTGNTYSGSVKHFSFWNYDIGGNAINLSLTLKDIEAAPLVHVLVRITRISSGWGGMAYGYTDSLGKVSGLVPSGELLKLDVLDDCNNSIFTQNVGPFSANTDLGVLTVTSPSSSIVTIKGTALNCSGAIVTNGYAIVDYDGYPRYVSTNSSGQFSVSILRCAGSPTTCDITAVDNVAQQQATVTGVTIIAPITTAGNITACGTSSAQYINYTLDGTNYVLSSTVPGDSLSAFSFQQGTTPFTTYFSGYNIGTNKSVNVRFNSATQVAGTYPIAYISAQNQLAMQPIAPSNVVLTSFPASAGGFYEGSFNGSYQDSANVSLTHTISGTFRLRK